MYAKFRTQCSCSCRCPGCCPAPPVDGGFFEYTDVLPLDGGTVYSRFYDIRDARVLSVLVKNTSNFPALFLLQNSPDGVNYLDDPETYEADPGQLIWMQPYRFSKYLRIKAVGGGDGPGARIWIQMQR